jgi:hypothetical protein
VQGLFEQFAILSDLAVGEYYNVLPYALYFQTRWHAPTLRVYRWGVIWWLIRKHLETEIQNRIDATHFAELILRPDGPISSRLPQAVVDAQLAQLAAEQAEDGGWPSPYSAAWRPWITTQNLLVLKAYGRLA